jgi:chromate transporter
LVKIALFVVTLVVLMRFKKLPEPIVVLTAAVIGLALYPLIHS